MYVKGNVLYEYSYLVCIMIFYSVRRDYMVIIKRGNNLFFVVISFYENFIELLIKGFFLKDIR